MAPLLNLVLTVTIRFIRVVPTVIDSITKSIIGHTPSVVAGSIAPSAAPVV